MSDNERIYPCADCGKLRSKNEGGTVFTVCDECWDKGKPPRLVPLNFTAESALRMMIADGQLPLPISRFEKRWYTALADAGINKPGMTREERFHWHDLRHQFGTELLKRGANPYHIKDLFAHTSMEVSSIYITSDHDHLRDTVRLLDDAQDIGGVQ